MKPERIGRRQRKIKRNVDCRPEEHIIEFPRNRTEESGWSSLENSESKHYVGVTKPKFRKSTPAPRLVLSRLISSRLVTFVRGKLTGRLLREACREKAAPICIHLCIIVDELLLRNYDRIICFTAVRTDDYPEWPGVIKQL